MSKTTPTNKPLPWHETAVEFLENSGLQFGSTHALAKLTGLLKEALAERRQYTRELGTERDELKANADALAARVAELDNQNAQLSSDLHATKGGLAWLRRQAADEERKAATAYALAEAEIVAWLRTTEGDGWTRDSDRLADLIEKGSHRKPDSGSSGEGG